MTSPNTSVFDALNATYNLIDRHPNDPSGVFRFEVRRDASIYIRKPEHRRGENRARINVIYIRNFPNLAELRAYIDAQGIQTDYAGRDYLIGAEHIDEVIRILS